jgi:hypothetical protein
LLHSGADAFFRIKVACELPTYQNYFSRRYDPAINYLVG